MGLPEFTPTQQIPGCIRAIMMKNDQSPYDFIVGMDTMQALGIDICCSTKTVTWNGNTILCCLTLRWYRGSEND